MPFGTPTLVATANNAALGASTTLTSSVPVHALIVVFLVDPDVAGTIVDATIRDTAGNTYLRAVTTPGGGGKGTGLFYCQNARALSVGGSFTVTGLTGQAHYSGGMAYVTGANGGLNEFNAVQIVGDFSLSDFGPDFSLTATSITIPTGPTLLTDPEGDLLTDPQGNLLGIPSVVDNVVVFGVMNNNNGLTGATDGGGFTSLTRAVVNTDFAYNVVTTPSIVNYTVSGFPAGDPLGVVAAFALGDVPYQSSRLLFC